MAPLALDPTPLSDRELLSEATRVAACEREATVALVALLAEMDARRLHLAEGCSSLFGYCTERLHLSEHAAYHRIEAARAVRDFPVILGALQSGDLTLTVVTLLRPHLTKANHTHLRGVALFAPPRLRVEALVRGGLRTAPGSVWGDISGPRGGNSARTELTRDAAKGARLRTVPDPWTCGRTRRPLEDRFDGRTGIAVGGGMATRPWGELPTAGSASGSGARRCADSAGR